MGVVGEGKGEAGESPHFKQPLRLENLWPKIGITEMERMKFYDGRKQRLQTRSIYSY